MELKSLLDQPNKLPTIPKVAQQVIESFSNEDVSIDEIARQLTADPALSAKLLRLANSAYFHVSRSIGTVDDAIRMLGFVMVRNLVVGNGMVAAFRNTPGMDLKQFWRYNLYTACASRWLAETAGTNADQAFTVGLMHGIGQLQMHAGMPAAMAPLDKKMHVLDAGRAELEKQTLGFNHGDVAAELAKIWNFPAPIILSLRDMSAPLAAEEFTERGLRAFGCMARARRSPCNDRRRAGRELSRRGRQAVGRRASLGARTGNAIFVHAYAKHAHHAATFGIGRGLGCHARLSRVWRWVGDVRALQANAL